MIRSLINKLIASGWEIDVLISVLFLATISESFRSSNKNRLSN